LKWVIGFTAAISGDVDGKINEVESFLLSLNFGEEL
jgi:hypothetical protein